MLPGKQVDMVGALMYRDLSSEWSTFLTVLALKPGTMCSD